jgi:hypothetical protein
MNESYKNGFTKKKLYFTSNESGNDNKKNDDNVFQSLKLFNMLYTHIMTVMMVTYMQIYDYFFYLIKLKMVMKTITIISFNFLQINCRV